MIYEDRQRHIHRKLELKNGKFIEGGWMRHMGCESYFYHKFAIKSESKVISHTNTQWQSTDPWYACPRISSKQNHTVCDISYIVWLLSLKISILKLIPVVPHIKSSFLFYCSVAFHCIETPCFVYPLTCCWTCVFFPVLDCYK